MIWRGGLIAPIKHETASHFFSRSPSLCYHWHSDRCNDDLLQQRYARGSHGLGSGATMLLFRHLKIRDWITIIFIGLYGIDAVHHSSLLDALAIIGYWVCTFVNREKDEH